MVINFTQMVDMKKLRFNLAGVDYIIVARGGSRKPLTIVRKSSILDVAAVLDPPLLVRSGNFECHNS